MAFFANTTAADLKKGDIIMFAMGSSSPGRVAPRADRCLGGQFACACPERVGGLGNSTSFHV
jgi:hypothetical protein